MAGKYSVEEGRLPEGPRGTLFKQLLPEVAPLVELVGEVARERGKTPSQVHNGTRTECADRGGFVTDVVSQLGPCGQ